MSRTALWVAMLLAIGAPALGRSDRQPAKARADAGVEFKGDFIRFRTTGEEFRALSYDEQSRLLDSQVAAVVKYVRDRTGETTIIELVGRLEVSGPREIKINRAPDPGLTEDLLYAARFAQDLTPVDAQKRTLRQLLDAISGETDPHFRYGEFSEKLFGFSDAELAAVDLSDVRDEIARALAADDIAKNIFGGDTKPDAERLERAMDWLFVNISIHFERPSADRATFKDLNDEPLELLLRGMGDCDRAANVLARLAFHAGIPAHVVYLHKKDNPGNSFHTLAEIRTARGWQAVDPYNNIIYPKGIFELSRDSEYFRHSVIMTNPASAQMLRPVMKLAEMICRFYRPEQRLFHDVRNSIAAFLNDRFANTDTRMIEDILTSLPQGRSVQVPPFEVYLYRWDYPFWMRGFYRRNLFGIYKERYLPFLSRLRDARMNQVLGRYKEADMIFAQLNTVDDPDPRFAEERDYFWILNAYFQENDTSVDKMAHEFRICHPDTPRNKMLRYVLAQSLKRLNRLREAAREYPAEGNFLGRGRILTQSGR